MCIFFQFLPHISISMSLKSFSIYIVKFFELYISAVLLPIVLQLLLLLFCRNKKNTLVEPFFNCLFTFTMECGAYSNNAMSSRSSFTKQQIFLREPLLNLYQKGKKKLVKPSFKLSWEPLIFQQNIYRRKIPQQCYRN